MDHEIPVMRRILGVLVPAELLGRKVVEFLELFDESAAWHLSVLDRISVLASLGGYDRLQRVCPAIAEDFPQGLWGRITASVMPDLVEVDAAQKGFVPRFVRRVIERV